MCSDNGFFYNMALFLSVSHSFIYPCLILRDLIYPCLFLRDPICPCLFLRGLNISRVSLILSLFSTTSWIPSMWQCNAIAGNLLSNHASLLFLMLSTSASLCSNSFRITSSRILLSSGPPRCFFSQLISATRILIRPPSVGLGANTQLYGPTSELEWRMPSTVEFFSCWYAYYSLSHPIQSAKYRWS